MKKKRQKEERQQTIQLLIVQPQCVSKAIGLIK